MMACSSYTVLTPIVTAQSIVTNQLYGGQYVCAGEVIFTCATMDSSIIAWSSREYINSGNIPLTFAAELHDEGDMRNSTFNQNTFATLITDRVENGVQVLVSRLRIVASLDSPTASVTCTHGNGTTDTQNFQVIGK